VNGDEFMRKGLCAAFIPAIPLCLSSTGSKKDKAVKIMGLLSADEIAVYRAVLEQYTSKEAGSRNVSVTPFPLDPSSSMSGLTAPDGWKGIQLEKSLDSFPFIS